MIDVKDDMSTHRFEDERAERLTDSAVKAADDAPEEACALARAMSEVAVPYDALADRWGTTADAGLLPWRHAGVPGGGGRHGECVVAGRAGVHR
jgi:hypothetical protein